MMKPHFARHGIPVVCVTDNAMQFASAEFANFAKTYGFKHVTSSPRYAQSNGFVERNVQSVKSLLKKAKRDKRDPYLAMLEIRNTPVDVNLGTPTQLLMGRRTKGLLPTTSTLLRPTRNSVKTHLQERQKKQKYYYDRQSKPLVDLKPGESVRIHDSSSTKPLKQAVVVRKLQEPRSYVVSSDGVEYRRNRRDLIKTSETNNTASELEDDLETVTSNQQEQSTENKDEPYKTRCGREVKIPAKLNDYVI